MSSVFCYPTSLIWLLIWSFTLSYCARLLLTNPSARVSSGSSFTGLTSAINLARGLSASWRYSSSLRFWSSSSSSLVFLETSMWATFESLKAFYKFRSSDAFLYLYSSAKFSIILALCSCSLPLRNLTRFRLARLDVAWSGISLTLGRVPLIELIPLVLGPLVGAGGKRVGTCYGDSSLRIDGGSFIGLGLSRDIICFSLGFDFDSDRATPVPVPKIKTIS